MERRIPVTFSPGGPTVRVVPGATVIEAARMAGILLVAPCGGRGVCGACGVRVISGSLAPPDEGEFQGLNRAPADVRLACRARVREPVTVRPVVLGAAAPAVSPPVGAPQGAIVAGVDLGTTSIATVLVDRSTGRELARATVPNAQAVFGSDILSRISAAQSGDGDELRHLASESIARSLEAAAARAGRLLTDVNRVVVVGNTAMTALFAGAELSSLGRHPFEAPYIEARVRADEPLVSRLAPDATVELLPPIASFVGSDALAGALAAGLVDAKEPVLLVDFGTNAEIVLAHELSLVVASAAAGPAFEGVGVSGGGPAADGAATSVAIAADGTVTLETMGGEPARWFSGSGLISAVGALRRCGHMDASGLMTDVGPLATRFSRDKDGVTTVRLGNDESSCLTITQLDVRKIQLAKAAVRVGIEAVLREKNLSASALDGVRIAGAFGSAIDPKDLVDLGIMPIGVAERIRHVGNASLEGAAAMALDSDLETLGYEVARSAHHVELASDPGFASALVAATEFAPYEVGE